MKTVVLDSFALIVYFEEKKGSLEVTSLLEAASREECLLLLSSINWGEIYYTTLREYGPQKAQEILEAIDSMPIKIAEADRDLILQAATLKSKGGLSYADCFAAALTKLHKGTLVTGDPEFKRVADEIKIIWLN